MTISISKIELKNIVNNAVVSVLENIGLLDGSKKAKNGFSLSVRHQPFKPPQAHIFKNIGTLII